MKKLTSILIVCLLFVTFLGMPGFAIDSKADVIKIPVVEFEDYSEYITYFKDIKTKDDVEATRGVSGIWASVIRDGTSENCELYLNWMGDMTIGGFRYKSITVRSANWIFPEVYKTFGDDAVYWGIMPDVAAVAGFVKVGDLEISDDVTDVHVQANDLQGYSMDSSSWLSGYLMTNAVSIN